ncbi:MAG TPA: DUF362 domain-containing protein [Bacteroidales bacterium]|nr:DUF362 domain-containing protein [Bacteroidales bacterium]
MVLDDYTLNRRKFLKTGMMSAGALAAAPVLKPFEDIFTSKEHIVSIVRIQFDRVDKAVEEAIDLLDGISRLTKHKQKIMLKPNLVFDSSDCTTKPAVIRTLAMLMKKAGKEVLIGEGSAAASGINADEQNVYRTQKADLLDRLQKQIFNKLGYTDIADELGIPLVNLHTGEMVTVDVPGAHHFKKLTLHKSLSEIDMLCSVPMMKTHVLATVTLGLKNVIGLYPGTAYCSVRSCVHAEAEEGGSKGVAFEIIDMARANKMGLTVIDGSMAMEGDGPSGGKLVKTDLIIAGTSPLAADMVASAIMGFEPNEIPHFNLAHESGMHPMSLDEIEIRGLQINDVRRPFERPHIIPFGQIKDFWGVKEV